MKPLQKKINRKQRLTYNWQTNAETNLIFAFSKCDKKK